MARQKRARAVDRGKTTGRRTSQRRSCTGASRGAGASYDAISSENQTATKRKKRMSSSGVRKGAARRGAGRAAKTDRWGEEFLTTNPKSPIVNVDLVKLLAHPSAWTCLDEDDKKEILDLLPEHIRPSPPTDDPDAPIPPIDPEFLRYSNNWRDGVRQFQVDLEQGKYQPQWLRQAAEAMEERADGKFDEWKEEQFEQFWGQKQKLDHDVIAGESSRVKLETLVQHDCVQVGDVWKYSRAFGKGSKGVLVEKEVKVIDSNGSELTFAIPPGQRAVLCETYDKKAQQPEAVKESDASVRVPDEIPEGGVDADIDPEASSNVPSNSVPDEQTSPAAESEPPPAESDRRTPTNDVESMAVDTHGDSKATNTPKQNEAEPDRETPTNEVEPMAVDACGDSKISNPPEPNEAESTHDDTMNQTQGVLDGDNGTETLDPSLSSAVEHMPLRGSIDSTSHDTSNVNKIEVLEGDQSDSIAMAATADGGKMDVDDPEHMQKLGSKEDETILPASENKGDDTEPIETTEATERTKATNKKVLKDVILKNVNSPQTLGNKILHIDGRIANPPNGNAWKDFRCYRHNQDIGSIWEVRQEWFMRHKPGRG